MQSVYSVLALIMATSFDEMVTKILSVLGIESLSDEVMTNLKGKGLLSYKSFLLTFGSCVQCSKLTHVWQ